MLTFEENQLLTRTNRGTHMGELFRRFWIPALLSEELPGPDCAPVRVTLMGERLVAFKDSDGNIGLLDRRCPHRLADLFWGRNEENGLRCVYHGWKFNHEGKCLDIPNAPEGNTYKEKIRAEAYPTREKAGIIWAYMGPKTYIPELPDLEWMRLPDSHKYLSKFQVDGNFVQAMEGDIDSSHVSFLHRDLNKNNFFEQVLGDRTYASTDTMPKYDTKETEYGIMMAARRNANEGNYYWRITQWLMPFFAIIPTPPGVTMRSNIRVPIDDEHSWQYRIRYNPERELNSEELTEYKSLGVDYPELIPGTYIPKENSSNDYLINRAAQKHYSYTGITSVTAQDMAVQGDQGGAIMDRTIEHLVSSDVAIIAMRKRLMTAAQNLSNGIEPAEIKTPNSYLVRAADIILNKDKTWYDEAMDQMTVSNQ